MLHQRTNRRFGSMGRPILRALAMLLALLVAIPLVGIAAAQSPPPGDDIVLVNAAHHSVLNS